MESDNAVRVNGCHPERMVVGSRALGDVIRIARKVAPAKCNILITGESGTGKELIARTIHENSGATSRPFVALNVAAIPETLIESHLFGHVRGAFTGADRHRVGAFATAAGGTLFLDEVAELPLSLQPKLLRAIESKEITPVGSDDPKVIDVRILAATDQNISEMVKEGTFRSDLYYRLNVVNIYIPPLRERREDIPLLVNYYLDHFGRQHGRSDLSVADEVLDQLAAADWYGNVRELAHAIERAVVLCEGNCITRDDLPVELRQKFSARRTTFRAAVDRFRYDYIRAALERHDGNRGLAARSLGISQATLYRYLRELGLKGYRRKGARNDPAN